MERAIAIEEEQASKRPEIPGLLDIMRTPNLATFLDASRLARIGDDLCRDKTIDDASRKDWLSDHDDALKAAMQKREPKTSPWPGAANVKYPTLTVAAIQFQARAYPAIIDGVNLVKGRVMGPDPDNSKADRAKRIGEHMSYQLLYDLPDWEPETDRLTLMLPIVGCIFRKTYFDPLQGKPASTIVMASDFVVNNTAKSLETVPRFTHVIRLYPYEVRERIAAGLWLDVPIDTKGEDSEAELTFYEQHRMLDLDGDGVMEHYAITATEDGQVARIAPCFDEDGVMIAGPDGRVMSLAVAVDRGLVTDEAQIRPVRIERQNWFTKYGFIPAPDGTFYDVGFGHLLKDSSHTIDSVLNQMLDAGALQNAQGGFIGSGVNMKGGEVRIKLGEWKRMDVTGGTLRENIVPLNLPGPSSVLFNLLGMMIEAAKEITSVQNVLTGEGNANQPATTTLALIEQGQKVMNAIFKRIHRAFGKELRILRRLNRDFGDEESYFLLTDEPQKIMREDYADRDLDVVPVSDPGLSSETHRLVRSEALMQFNGDPLVNQVEIRRRRLQALGETDIDKLLEVPPPQPDPAVLEAGARMALQKEEMGAKVRASDARSASDLLDAAAKAAGLGLVSDAAALAGAAVELGGDVMEEDNGQPAAESIELSPLEGGPADTGISGPAGIAAGGPDDGLGFGQADDPGASGAGGPAGESGQL